MSFVWPKWFRSSPAGNGDHDPAPQGGASAARTELRTVYTFYPEIESLRVPKNYPDISDPVFWRVFEQCKAYSLLSIEAFYNLFRSVEYVAANNIPGEFVECGVFLGGAVLAMSEFALHFGLKNRRFFLYDTFAGFPGCPSEIDLHGKKVQFTPHADFLAQVQGVIATAAYPAELFQFVAGPVEQTLAATKPARIALLRLDTDYYESTRVEMVELYPRLSPGGVLIIDDYGQFQGARRAVDEFMAQQPEKMLLSRINFDVRAGVKPGPRSTSG